VVAAPSSGNYAHFVTGSATAANNFANMSLNAGYTFIPTLGTNTLTIPAVGQYILTVSAQSGSAIPSSSIFTAVTNGSFNNWASNGQGGNYYAPTGSTLDNITTVQQVTVTAPGAVLTWLPIDFNGDSEIDMIITQVPTGSV
jgi:hypothetical protein